jgi:beta-lactamase superfamily II metal-dependent hydrolase
LIEFAGRRVLLCSDIEKPAQRQIRKLYPALQADAVVVPHHGSVRTLDDEFLAQLAPTVLICSCGRTDYEQGRVVKPPEGVTRVVTAVDGAAIICIDRAGVITIESVTGHAR